MRALNIGQGRTNWWASVVAMLVIAANAAYGTGFRNPPETAAALGRIGGRIALTDDASAVILNPANLVDLDGRNVIASVTIVHAEIEYRGASGSADTKDPWKVLPNFFYAAPLADGQYAWGISLTTPYGQSTEWDQDDFAFTSAYFAELRTIDIRPTFAVRLGDWLQVGAGLDIMWSDIEFKQLFPWAAVTGNPTSLPGNARFEGDGVGIGAGIGVSADFADNQRLSLVYRSKSKLNYDGDFDVSNVPSPTSLPGPLGAIISPSSDFDTDITFPSMVALGYGIAFREDVRLGVDVEWWEFSTFDDLPIDISNNNPLLPSRSIPQNWKDTWLAGLGLEWDATDQWTVRGGYVFAESPVVRRYLGPPLPDADRHILTVGAGYTLGRHQLDAALAFSIYDDITISNSANPAFNGNYDIDSQLISLTYGYTF